MANFGSSVRYVCCVCPFNGLVADFFRTLAISILTAPINTAIIDVHHLCLIISQGLCELIICPLGFRVGVQYCNLLPPPFVYWLLLNDCLLFDEVTTISVQECPKANFPGSLCLSIFIVLFLWLFTD